MRFNEFSQTDPVTNVVNNHGAMSDPVPLDQFIRMLRGETVEAQQQPTRNMPLARASDMLTDTLQKHGALREKLAAFLQTKLADHMASFGASDKHYASKGSFGSLGIGLKHAHLTHDISVVYRIHGNPPTIDIYGLYSHDESGTGTPPNMKRQKALASKIARQQNFAPVNPDAIRKK